MKHFTFIHILLFLLCMLIYKCSHAQDYVVNMAGDTIKGDVKLLSFGTDQRVQVKHDNGKENFTVVQTKTVSLNNELYLPVKGPSGFYEFMKPVKQGYLSLYLFQQSGRYDGMYLVKADGDALELPNLAFKKFMTRYLGECETVAHKIEAGELAKKDINQIVDEFNNCIEKNSAPRARPVKKVQPATPPVSDKWIDLERKVRAADEFEGKTTALEMIADIKKRKADHESVPNFVIDGLKNILANQPDLTEALTAALAE